MRLKSADYCKYIAILDMGLLWRLSAPSTADREKDDVTVYTWKDYEIKVFETILRRHPSASMIIAVNGCYKNDAVNIKGREPQKCSAAYVGGQTKNVFPAKERHFPGIKEFNGFFENPLNKICLQAFLKSHFVLRRKEINKGFIYPEKNNCQDILSSLLKSSAEKFCCLYLETDTAMLFLYSRTKGYYQTTPVLIDSEDTDVVVISAYATSIMVNLQSDVSFNAKDLCSKKICKTIVPLHVMTGCNVTSSFLVLAKELCGIESRKV